MGWNVVEGVVAIAAAAASGSIALLGFGVDSFVETASGAILIWRLRSESHAMDAGAIERLDRRARQRLARAKRWAAIALGSRALEADSFQTTACGWLSLITLSGVELNTLVGWWWADPAAALAMTWFLVREGREAWRGDECCT